MVTHTIYTDRGRNARPRGGRSVQTAVTDVEVLSTETDSEIVTRLATAIAVLLALPASATAAARHYFPKAHHPCRAHYARHFVKVTERKHGRTVTVKRAECVYEAPKQLTVSTASGAPTPSGAPSPLGTAPSPGIPAPTGTIPTTSSVNVHDSMTTWFSVAGSAASGGQELVGKPLTYTVTDATTGRQVATFTGTSNSYSSCTVVYSIQGGVKTYSGQPVPPIVGCNLTAFSMPAADAAVLTATFAGDATYAPSTSSGAAFS